jgi:arylsulfatase A-like enzyme
VASLLTGRMPSAHRLVRLFDRLPDTETTLAERLAARGFATAAVVSHLLLDADYGFGQGFAHFDASAAGGHRAITSPEVTDAALAWLDRWAAGEGSLPAGAAASSAQPPFFLLVHYFDPHYVYRHHPRFDRTAGYRGPLHSGMDIWALRDRRSSLTAADVDYLTGLYREEVAFTDHHLGRLLTELERRDLAGDTLVVVTADHGEELMRHGWIGHTRTLYDELLHVPLVVSLPGRLAPRVVDEPVSLVDLVPTLLAMSERPEEVAGGTGVSLLPWLRGESPGGAAVDRDLFAEVSFAPVPGDEPRMIEKAAFKTALLAGPLKLVHDLAVERWHLFDRAADPEELRDLAGTGHPAERRLQRRLTDWERQRDEAVQADAARVTPDAEELDRLRALGYLR